MPEEINELHERAEHGRTDPSLAPVTVTMAILAMLVAGVGVMGHRAHTKEFLFQTRATDEWAFYQAKEIRRRNYEMFLDQVAIFNTKDAALSEQAKQKYLKEVDRLKSEGGEIQNEARNMEQQVEQYESRANRFDLGELLLEAALVIVSITVLTRNRSFWLFGMALGAAGVVTALSGLLK